MSSDGLYAESLKLESTHNDVALFSTSTSKIEIMVGTKPTVTYQIVSLMGRWATPNLNNDAFIMSQCNSLIKHPSSLRIQTGNKNIAASRGNNFIKATYRRAVRSSMGWHRRQFSRSPAPVEVVKRPLIRSIFSGVQKLDPFHSTPIATINSHNASV